MNLQYFGERLRLGRVRLGTTQDEMAERLGVSKRSYCAYEAGETAPSAKLLAALAEVEGFDIDYLLTGKTLQDRAAESVAQLPFALREFRGDREPSELAERAGIAAAEWMALEQGEKPFTSTLVMHLITAFPEMDVPRFIGQPKSRTTENSEEAVLLDNYRSCTAPDQDAIRHQAAFLASRNNKKSE